MESMDNNFSLNGVTHIQKSDTVDLKYQVAGHSRVGLLTHKNGYVLKPVQKEPLGSREIEFYRRIFNYSKKTEFVEDEDYEKCIELFHQVLPRFYGVGIISSQLGGSSETTDRYLILDNIVYGFQNPSVVDLKIGSQTWDPDASEKKISHEKSKYTGTKSQLGISVTGMHYYDLSSQTSVRCEEGFGKTLNTESIYTVLQQFLNTSSGLDTLLSKLILTKLTTIKSLFNLQRIYNFYSSSILIAYDTEHLVNLIKQNNNDQLINPSTTIELLDQSEDCRWLRVWMIDFAHVHPNTDGRELDLNYMFGLDHLIEIFRSVVGREDRSFN